MNANKKKSLMIKNKKGVCQLDLQGVNWCFTHNLKEDEWKKTDEEKLQFVHDYVNKYYSKELMNFMRCGYEIGKLHGIHHIQAWFQLKKRQRGRTIKKHFDKRIHLIRCKGTEFENEKYCKKDNLSVTKGDFRLQGNRSDLMPIQFEQVVNEAHNNWRLNCIDPTASQAENILLYLDYAKKLTLFNMAVTSRKYIGLIDKETESILNRSVPK